MLSICALLATACSATSAGYSGQQWENKSRPSSTPRVTGIIGITEVTALGVNLNNNIGNTVEDADTSMPLIGAQVQVPLRPGRLEFGYEGGFSLGWDSEHEAYYIDTGVVLVATDNKVRLFDVSGGLYLSTMLGRRWRLYGGAGPVFQFGKLDLDYDQPINGRTSDSGSGVGLGYYARTGLEVKTSPGTSVGLVVRWVDSSVDLGGTLGDLDIEALQVGIAVTSGF